jgi:hypothetical protein
MIKSWDWAATSWFPAVCRRCNFRRKATESTFLLLDWSRMWPSIKACLCLAKDKSTNWCWKWHRIGAHIVDYINNSIGKCFCSGIKSGIRWWLGDKDDISPNFIIFCINYINPRGLMQINYIFKSLKILKRHLVIY